MGQMSLFDEPEDSDPMAPCDREPRVDRPPGSEARPGRLDWGPGFVRAVQHPRAFRELIERPARLLLAPGREALGVVDMGHEFAKLGGWPGWLGDAAREQIAKRLPNARSWRGVAALVYCVTGIPFPSLDWS